MGEFRIDVGTSSWADPGFVEEWYPPGLRPRERLAWYAEHFDAVEVNSTFYAIPGASTVARWAEVTPAHFTFDVKLHRALSRHAAGEDSLPKALRPRAKLGPRGRVVLDDRLEGGWLGVGEARRAHARVFAEREVAWVGVDAPVGDQVTIMPALDAATRDDVAYLRAHGRNHEGYVRGRSVAERFAHRYADEELQEIGERARWLAERAERVRLMFNNNRGSDAPVAAQRMRELLGQEVGGPRTGAAAP